ncbi:hypothetical protein [Spiroplasma endosymbiont of Phyllotreta cruciferae]|uniref:hypothetical protein n=1 Tax=Spiroplasma endosymbiont of Phyllotreta cruciferae TaxID=2886375 RepID=UPI0020A03684|nr:hypothetical protein [Spiroplasma endosymbiont of Phyllotreta cruciferae]
MKIFNLGKINPLNYEKIEILGEGFKTVSIWGDENYWNGKNIYWGEKTINSINEDNFKKWIRNNSFSNRNIQDIGNDDPSIGDNIILDKKKLEWWDSAWFEHSQSVGFTFYWKNDNYYLQFLARQHGNSGGSFSKWRQIMKVGYAIRLYND